MQFRLFWDLLCRQSWPHTPPTQDQNLTALYLGRKKKKTFYTVWKIELWDFESACFFVFVLLLRPFLCILSSSLQQGFALFYPAHYCHFYTKIKQTQLHRFRKHQGTLPNPEKEKATSKSKGWARKPPGRQCLVLSTARFRRGNENSTNAPTGSRASSHPLAPRGNSWH